jgi:Rieske Fe-S protein
MSQTWGVDPEALAPETGQIGNYNGQPVAVFKTADGEVRAVSAVCTHLGCTVGFNPTDRTWDCPCHGSRYDLEGHVIRGPAASDLEPVAGD